MMTDPIADMLTRIRNAVAARKRSVDIPFSKMKHALALLLEREGYIDRVEVAETRLTFRLHLRYDEKGKSVLHMLNRMSKPGRRLYLSKEAIPSVLGGFGIAILSTPRGLLTNKEARKFGVGGEFICTVA